MFLMDRQPLIFETKWKTKTNKQTNKKSRNFESAYTVLKNPHAKKKNKQTEILNLHTNRFVLWSHFWYLAWLVYMFIQLGKVRISAVQ